MRFVCSRESHVDLYICVKVPCIYMLKNKKILLYMCIRRSVPGVFGNQQANYLDLIKQMLQQAVVDITNYEVMHIHIFI